MGLLVIGTPLAFEDSKKYIDHVKYHGITQFLHLWDRLKDRQGDQLLWGDEVEMVIVSFHDQQKRALLSLSQTEILKKLSSVCNDLTASDAVTDVPPTFHPEFGRYMLESTPGEPYDVTIKSLLSVEPNMRWRRALAKKYLSDDELPMTFTAWCRLGCTDESFTDPPTEAGGEAAQSLFLPDQIINEHVRFPTLAANIRRRRGSKVCINVPIYKDVHTPSPFIDPSIPWDRTLYAGDREAKDGAAKADHIYMDAMGFGMGCCCLQITFQACDVEEGFRVYDALAPVAPIMLALSANSPAYRGYLADVDCRWNVISAGVDDRTEEERGLKPLKENKFVIPKSRYDSIDSYISADAKNRPEYNDIPLQMDEGARERLIKHGVPPLLSNHVAHLFIRDPLVIFSEAIDMDDETSTDHFENLQSTNWQTLRFKPPPPNTNIGWRVEFRSMEVQLTDYENAAYSVFIVLLTRAILSFGLNFYIPISKVDENMKRAQPRDAVKNTKFYFRKQVFPGRSWSKHDVRSRPPSPKEDQGVNGHSNSSQHSRNASTASVNVEIPEQSLSGHATPVTPVTPTGPVDDEYEEMTINEIMNGKGEFPGLIGVVNSYLNSLNIDFTEKAKIRTYLELIKGRANGSIQTAAAYTRNFITSHPLYKKDSVVSAEIAYDLARHVNAVERGDVNAECLLGSHYIGSASKPSSPK